MTFSSFKVAVPELIVAVPETSVPMVAVPDTARLVPERSCPKEWGSQRNKRAQSAPTAAANTFFFIGLLRRWGVKGGTAEKGG